MKLCLFLLSLLCTFSAMCETSLALIQETAEGYVQNSLDSDPGARISVEANELDSRRHFDSCEQPLQAQAPNGKSGARYVTVKVSCPGPSPWLVYVPVQVTVEYPVVIATTTLGANTVIDNTMLEVRYVNSNSIRGNHFSHPDELNGARLKRRTAAGQAISQHNICLVCKGDPVVIVVNNDNLSIRTSGVALSGGSLGESVRVQNSNSRRMVEAYVSAIGQVEVKM
ncbi:flagella basal body P-ring formation protein FlgA [Ferrimonas sediminum]|uniref:Flagella basal body P-ring formation protein FlgA n=2 Tax=Ferrimonas sediminum TaxID=718193 RepID=A0A1G8YRR7_9GAMM|nr:flagella basal body P-ring formation protein FlgA [Ferrimonas sediminum]